MDGICQRYGVLPSAVFNEDSYLHRMLTILSTAGKLGGDDKPAADPVDRSAGSDADLAALQELI